MAQLNIPLETELLKELCNLNVNQNQNRYTKMARGGFK